MGDAKGGAALRVAVLGASGVYGRHLVPRLCGEGYAVRALARDPARAAGAAACGADLRRADVFDEDSLRAALDGCDVAIHLATRLPGPSGDADRYAENDRLRREGTPLWVRACRDAGVERIVQQSIALVHASEGDAWTDESVLPSLRQDGAAKEAVSAVLAMESAVRETDLDWVVLRGGLFYGPGTRYDDEWFERARAGTLRLPGDGSRYVSLVHIADMADATVRALRHWPSRQALIVADDEPTTWRDLLGHVAILAGAAPPRPGGRERLPSWRVRNHRAKEALRWAPRYPTYRVGLVR